MRNPFPGLRPFEPDEDHLFFGREREIDELLRRLASRRFLSVVGTSGSGKSSLVRSGLIPSLYSGASVRAGSRWRVAMLRPGEDPIGNLAAALDARDVLATDEPADEFADGNRAMLDATLRRGTLGLVDAVRLARIRQGDNVLVVVDQFEELFRFQRSRHIDHARDEAVAFVKLLLEAARQQQYAIYVVLTMRSDFIGDCMAYPGLPEAINDSVYLVPRMSRDELRLAITGPVAVAGGEIDAPLVQRLLNDVGDDPDQLPLMQHVLMRTWDHWARHRSDGAPMSLTDYEAVGTLQHALSLHADEAYDEAGSNEKKHRTQLIFRALTDTFSDPRGVRRPTAISDLAAICTTSEADVTEIVELFRRPGRSFLVPPAAVALSSDSIVDLSHESLMRCWTRLIEWAREERASAAQYVRLSREATWHHEGAAALWNDPELELGLRWREANHPTAAWARQIEDSSEAYSRAMDFLDRSEAERERERAERERERRERHAQRVRNVRILQGSAAALLVMLLFAIGALKVARDQARRAENNLAIAQNAVEETLLAAEQNPEEIGADIPEMKAMRRLLLDRARGFYAQFIAQKPGSESFEREMGTVHYRLGDANRLLEQPDSATAQYRSAIGAFSTLAASHPDSARYRQLVASSWNWLGETARPLRARHAQAAAAYDSALALQQALVKQYPDSVSFRRELARTYYNRGILRFDEASAGDSAFRSADADFREAIVLLEPLAQSGGVKSRQELARAYNNRAALLEQDSSRADSAIALYARAAELHRELVRRNPTNREYRFELARFLDNLAVAARDHGELARADSANSQALAAIEELLRPAPSIAIEQADAYTVRGSIRSASGARDAARDFAHALDLFRQFDNAVGSERPPAAFIRRLGDLLGEVGVASSASPGDVVMRTTLSDAVALDAALWQKAKIAGRAEDARQLEENVRDALELLPARDRRRLLQRHEAFRTAVEELPARTH